MRAPIHPEQVRRIDVGVALGGGKALVAQLLLDRAKVGAARQHVGGASVAQRVGMNASDTRFITGLLHDAPSGTHSETPAAMVAKERRGLVEPSRREGAEQGIDRSRCGRTKGNDAVFASLAIAHTHQPLGTVHIEAVEGHRLTHPQPSAIQHLQKRPVPQRKNTLLWWIFHYFRCLWNL